MTSMIDVRVYEYAAGVNSTREMTMEILLEIASQFAESRFDWLGKLYSMWHAITSDGKHAILQPKGTTNAVSGRIDAQAL